MSLFEPNSSQKAVLEARGCLCVSAGAGSGKTGTLVATVLERLEAPGSELDILDVLALTFTEKAAVELRQRLGQAFAQKALTAEAERRPFWLRQSAVLDRADIGTIHGYALRLVRENALALGLADSPALDEDERVLAEDIREIALDWLEEKQPEYLALLDIYRGPERLFEILLSCASQASAWGLGGFVSAPWLGPPQTDWALALPQLRLELEETLSYIERTIDPAKSYYESICQSLKSLRELLSSATAAEAEKSLEQWLHILDASGNWYQKGAQARKKELRARLENLAAAAMEKEAQLRQALLIELLKRLRLDLARRKRLRGTINFDDILILARRLLASQPRLRQAEAARRRFILIDEFQDTNRLQTAILGYLLLDPADERVWPEEHDPWAELKWPLVEPKFMAFGDLKQSIYRFRGAEVEIMEETQRNLKEIGGALALDRNYRSQKSLVNFFNTFFSRCLPLFGLQDIQSAQKPDLHDGAHVTRLSSARPPSSVSERGLAGAALTVRYLKDLFSGRLGLVTEDADGSPRPLGPHDVAILFRRKKDIPIFRQALEAAGWSCRQPTGDNPFRFSEVRGLMGGYLYLSGVDEQVSLTALLRSPLGPVSAEALLELAWPQDDEERDPKSQAVALSLYFPLDASPGRPWPKNLAPYDRQTLQELRELLASLAPLSGRLSAVEIIERLAEARQLLALARAESPERVRAITAFTARCRRLGRDPRQPLGAAEELKAMRENWDDRYDGNRAAGGDGQAISLMTVHGAKGLEFPLVIVAEADYQPKLNSSPALISPSAELALRFSQTGSLNIQTEAYQRILKSQQEAERQEHLRLLYVATTRAKDQLVFLGWPPEEKEKKEKKDKASAEEKQEGSRSWLDILLACPEALELTEALNYDESRLMARQAPAPPSAAAPLESATPRAELLPAMRLSDQSFSVTALSHLLADPQGYFQRQYWGLDRHFQYRAREPFFPLSPTDAGAGEHRLAPTEAGSLFHAVLELADPLKPELEPLLEDQARRLALKPTPAELKDISSRLRLFLHSSLGRAWARAAAAGRPHFRELPFWLKAPAPVGEGSLSVSGVIDLFFLDEEGRGQIVDYKLAAFAQTAELAGYANQLTIYAQALRANGFGGLLQASVYFAGGEEPFIYEVELNQYRPLAALMERLAPLWPRLARPLNPQRPEL